MNTSSILRRSAAAAIAAVALAIGSDAAAQSPHDMIDTLRTMALERGPYSVEVEPKSLVVIDPETRERFVVATVDADRITMTGRVGWLRRRDRAMLDNINASVAAFNLGFRSARMELDRTTGELTITRVIDVGGARRGELALAIVRFGDLVHEERAKLEAAQKSAGRYCAVTCRPEAYDSEATTR